MAHECPECYRECHCGGDIDDINFGPSDSCTCPYTKPPEGCGFSIGYDDDSLADGWQENDWDDEEDPNGR